MIRPDLASREELLTIEMQGVQGLHMNGGPSRSMLKHPERINWGLAEVV